MLKEIINFSCLNFLKEHIPYFIFADKNINDYRICTGKGHDQEEYDAFHAEVAEEMKALGFTGEVESYQIGCTIGVHTGPTPIGIACIKKFDA